MNQLCPVCVYAVMTDEHHALNVVTTENVDNGPIEGNQAARARMLHGLAVSPDPGGFGFFRHRGSGYEYYVFAVTVVNGEPRCAMHMHIREQPWRV